MADEDEYAAVCKSKIVLKTDSGIKKKKKKQQKMNTASKETQQAITQEVIEQLVEEQRTKAEKALQYMQERLQKERARHKAKITHKQRVEKFNQYLDSLTEHFDFPKVS